MNHETFSRTSVSLMNLQFSFRTPDPCLPTPPERFHLGYRGTSLVRNTNPPKTTLGPWAEAYSRVLARGVRFRMSEALLYVATSTP